MSTPTGVGLAALTAKLVTLELASQLSAEQVGHLFQAVAAKGDIVELERFLAAATAIQTLLGAVMNDATAALVEKNRAAIAAEREKVQIMVGQALLDGGSKPAGGSGAKAAQLLSAGAEAKAEERHNPGPNPRPKAEVGAGTRDTETPAPRPPHFGPEALLASVESGAIAPLRGRWLVDLEARGGRVQRRQDLPPEAFFPADELRRLVEALGDNYGLLFAGLSYRWLSKDNPDPDGFHLKIVAAVARVYMHADGDTSPLTKAFATKGLGAPDFALFWDFASLFQQPREEPKQVELFKEGLKASNVWYGHESTVCWMQTELPPDIRFDAHIAQTYDESGWCFVEAAISAGLKVGKRRLDLAKRTDKAMEFAYGGGWIPEAMLEGVCAAARLPPLLPDEVRRRLDEKKFTSKADVDVVDGLYRAFFDGAADSATQLNFSGLGWAEAEARQLKEVLPRFTRLKALDLSRNALGAAGASAIVSLLKTMQISSLNLQDNHLGPKGGAALADGLKGNSTLKELNLQYNNLDDEAKQAVQDAAGSGVDITF